jgi:hypothetical protein
MKIKKILSFLAALVLAVGLFAGCNGEESAKISDYISISPDTVYRYQGTGHEMATQVIYHDYVNADTQLYQRRIAAGGKLVAECLRIADGALTVYYGADNFYSFFDLTDAGEMFETVVLKEPLTKGTRWERDKTQIGTTEETLEMASIMAEITGENVDVTVPYGKFQALEVTVTTEHTEEVRMEYYVKGIGLVKQVNHMRTFDTSDNSLSYTDSTSELAAVEENMDYTAQGYFFYPDTVTKEILYENRQIHHRTNEDPKEKLDSELKNYQSKNTETALFGQDTKINDVSILYNEGKVKVDFSSQLEMALTMAPDLEELYLQALVNTIGYYFNVSNVCITVDGEGYQGSITMGADEYRTIEASINIDETAEE